MPAEAPAGYSAGRFNPVRGRIPRSFRRVESRVAEVGNDSILPRASLLGNRGGLGPAASESGETQHQACKPGPHALSCEGFPQASAFKGILVRARTATGTTETALRCGRRYAGVTIQSWGAAKVGAALCCHVQQCLFTPQPKNGKPCFAGDHLTDGVHAGRSKLLPNGCLCGRNRLCATR